LSSSQIISLKDTLEEPTPSNFEKTLPTSVNLPEFSPKAF